jgi:hypothetical protein
MSQLLIKWLNEDVCLSRQIESLDNDFRDGYLLGELLFKFNQQPDFSSFLTSQTPDARINNFSRLEGPMRALGVFFNSRVGADIMDGKPGTVKTLLYELKTSLESYSRGYKKLSSKAPKMLKVIENEKISYNKTMSVTFDNAIRASAKISSLDLYVAELKDKSDEFHEDLTAKHNNDMEMYRTDIAQSREMTRQRQQREREFMKAWDDANVKQWKVNQTIAKTRREKEKTRSQTMFDTIEKKKTTANTIARETVNVELEEFEKTLKREMFKNNEEAAAGSSMSSTMFKTAGGQPGTGVPQLLYLNVDTLREGFVATQKVMKERHEDIQVRQQARMRRRKRFVREKESVQARCLLAAAENDIAEQLLGMNQSEEVEKLARTRVLVQTSLMKENKLNRDKYVKSLDDEVLRGDDAYRVLQVERELNWIIRSRLAAQSERREVLAVASSSARHSGDTEFVSAIVEDLLEITDWVANCRLVGIFSTDADGAPIPKELWADAQGMYSLHPVPVATALPLPVPCNVYSVLPHSLSAKPLCADQGWLMGALFTGGSCTAGDVGAAEDGSSAVSAGLARRDASAFISAVALAELAGGEALIAPKPPAFHTAEASPPAAAAAVPEGDAAAVAALLNLPKIRTLVDNPSWLFQSKVRQLLGGIIIKTRCVADPLPADPAVAAPPDEFTGPAPAAPVPRIALCGPSDSLKREIALRVQREAAPAELSIISVHELITSLVSLPPTNVKTPKWLSDEDAESLRETLFADISSGGEVADQSYVKLVTTAISSLPSGVGYILEDFPNTKEQARLLFLALTGIDRTLRRPQPGDRASAFAVAKEEPFVDYDPSLVGLDAVFFVKPEDLMAPVEHRLRSRRDLKTGGIVTVDESFASVEAIAEVYTPDLPPGLLSVGLQLARSEMDPLVALLGGMDVLHEISVRDHSAESLDRAAASVLSVVTPLLPADLPSASSAQEQADQQLQLAVDEQSGDAALPSAAPQPQAQAADQVAAPAQVEVRRVEGNVQRPVAKALARLWEVVEQQSRAASERFYSSVRDVRYRLVQRRRCVHDVIRRLYNVRDDKQAMFDAFREGFNSFDNDFRFDPDLRAELHLRTLELRSAMWDMAGQRKKRIEVALKKICNDGIIALLVHRVQGEGASLIQSEVNKFKTSLNLIFDYLRTSAAYPYPSAVSIAPEECLVPPENPYELEGTELAAAAGGKEKGGKAAPAKGAKGAEAKGPLRPAAVPPIAIDREAMAKLPPEPSADGEEKVEETTAKGKAPAKVCLSLFSRPVCLISESLLCRARRAQPSRTPRLWSLPWTPPSRRRGIWGSSTPRASTRLPERPTPETTAFRNCLKSLFG